jgi:tetratricopeptide (TPR) repeat protein
MQSKNAIVYLGDEARQAAGAWLEAAGFSTYHARCAREVGKMCDQHDPHVVVLEGPFGRQGSGVEVATWLRKAGIECPVLFHCGSNVETHALAHEEHLRPFDAITTFDAPSRARVAGILADDSRREVAEFGGLDESSLSDVLRHCFETSWTGKVELEHGGTTKAIIVENGNPVYCSSNIYSENFGQMLLRQDVITEVEYEWARKIQLKEGIRQGEALVKIGVLTSRTLHDHLHAQIREKLINAFAWDSGTYRLVTDDSLLDHTTRFLFNPVDIMVSGRGRFIVREDVRELWRRMGNLWAVCVCEDERMATAVHEWLQPGAINALREPVALSEVAIDAGWSKSHALAVFLVLEALGYVRVADGREGLPLGSHITPVTYAEIQVGGETYLAVDVVDEDDDTPQITEKELNKLADGLWSAYLNLTGSDHFTALGVAVDATDEEVETARDDLLTMFSREAFAPLMAEKRSANALTEIRGKVQAAADVLLNAAARREYVDRVADKPGVRMSKYLSAEDEFVAGTKMLEGGDAAGAMEHFGLARQLNNQEPVYEMYFGWSAFCAAKSDEDVQTAKRHLTRAIATNPLLDDGYVFLARVYNHLGDPIEAAEQARTALAFNPGNEEAQAIVAAADDSSSATVH